MNIIRLFIIFSILFVSLQSAYCDTDIILSSDTNNLTFDNTSVDWGDDKIKLRLNGTDNFDDSNMNNWVIPAVGVYNQNATTTYVDYGDGDQALRIATDADTVVRKGKIYNYEWDTNDINFTWITSFNWTGDTITAGEFGYTNINLTFYNATTQLGLVKIAMYKDNTDQQTSTTTSHYIQYDYNKGVWYTTTVDVKDILDNNLTGINQSDITKIQQTIKVGHYEGATRMYVNFNDFQLIPNSLSGNVTTNIRNSSDGNVLQNVGYNGGNEIDTHVNIYGNASSDNITWTDFSVIKINAVEGILYDVDDNLKKQYYIIRYELNSSSYNTTSISNLTIGRDISSSINITSYAPETPNSTYENVAATFNATIDQSNSNNEWLINGTWQEDDISTGSPEYTNSTWLNGTYNLTLISHNSTDHSLTDSQTWIVTVLLNSVDIEVTYWNPDSGGLVATINITNITAGVQTINFLLNDTNANYLYNVTYSNGTYVDSATATYENESLNFSIPLVEDSYNITETLSISTIIIPANSLGMFNNWTTATTFSAIAANESNDKAYHFYNTSAGEWESYYVGYSWNANNVIGKDNSVIGFFNAETTITSQIITPSSTELHEGWNMLAVQNSGNQIISDIKANIGANCTDVWWFNSTSGSYSNTTSDTVQANQGILTYVNTTFTWPRSDL